MLLLLVRLELYKTLLGECSVLGKRERERWDYLLNENDNNIKYTYMFCKSGGGNKRGNNRLDVVFSFILLFLHFNYLPTFDYSLCFPILFFDFNDLQYYDSRLVQFQVYAVSSQMISFSEKMS